MIGSQDDCDCRLWSTNILSLLTSRTTPVNQWWSSSVCGLSSEEFRVQIHIYTFWPLIHWQLLISSREISTQLEREGRVINSKKYISCKTFHMKGLGWVQGFWYVVSPPDWHNDTNSTIYMNMIMNKEQTPLTI